MTRCSSRLSTGGGVPTVSASIDFLPFFYSTVDGLSGALGTGESEIRGTSPHPLASSNPNSYSSSVLLAPFLHSSSSVRRRGRTVHVGAPRGRRNAGRSIGGAGAPRVGIAQPQGQAFHPFEFL